MIGVIDLLTASPVLTGLLQTLIDVLFTIFPLKSRGTLALVAVDQVDAGGPVLALVDQAVVNIPFTLAAGVSRLAGACVGIYAIYTGAAVLTLNFLEIFTFTPVLITFVLAWHSSMFSVQKSPWKPGRQRHELAPTPSTQVPPFSHSTSTQSSRFSSQLWPIKPSRQLHSYPAT